MDNLPVGLRNFLNYVAGNLVENDDFVIDLDKKLLEIKSSDEWKELYMTERDLIRSGYLEGEKAGVIKGKLEMIDSMLSQNYITPEQAASMKKEVLNLAKEISVED